jgi:CubicO group peptidase (beta-lactamase class C family)
MRELMTHTAGFTYGFFGDTPVDKMYRDGNLLASANLQEFIEKLAKIPLLYQPGQGWTYSMSMDIQGYIVEKLSGKSLPDFFRDNIYTPLGMRDAGFFVPADKRNRFSVLYRANPNGELTADPSASRRAGDYDVQPPMPSGGGGMVSTAEDYYRFATMLLNRGRQIRHRFSGDEARVWLWIRPRGCLRSARSESLRRQGDVLLGWGRGHLVLG